MTDSERAKAESVVANKTTDDHQHQWLAHELHDGLLQWVVGARMQIESALAKLDRDSAAARNLDQAIIHMHNALTEGRSLIGFLESQELGECDVVKEIAIFLESVQSLTTEQRQSVRFALPNPSWPELPKRHAWSLLRFVQQAVQNAIQHAGPTTIEVCLGWSNAATKVPMIRASIEDHGIGFDPNSAATDGHFGLQNLQQRANMCGGRFELVTSPGHGCRVALIAPLVN